MSLQDVQNSVNSAKDGDSVVLPAGTANWSSNLTVSKNINLVGNAGTGANASQITGSGNKGQFITFTTDSSDSKLNVSNIWFNIVPSPACRAPWILIGGTARVHYSAGVLCGGFRFHHCHFTSTTTGNINWIISFGDWVTGLIDYNWFDFSNTIPQGTASVFNLNHSGSPGQVASSSTLTRDGAYPALGAYSYYIPYLYGGGSSGNAWPNNSDFASGKYDAVYIENNIIQKLRGVLDNDDLGGGLRGGGRVVFRHNSSWTGTGGHGFNESGGNMNQRVAEVYNNLFAKYPGSTTLESPLAIRGGVHIHFNNRIKGNFSGATTGATAHEATFQESHLANNPGVFLGAGDGTCPWDINSTDDPLVFKGLAWRPDGRFPALAATAAETADSRIGRKYFECASSCSSTCVTDCKTVRGNITGGVFRLNGFGSSSDVANKYKGFTLRNETLAPAEDQNQARSQLGVFGALIMASSYDTLSGGTTVKVMAGHDANLSLNPTDKWSMRYIKKALGLPGTGKMNLIKGGINYLSAMGAPKIVAPLPTPNPNPRWPNVAEDGVWSWGNKYWSASQTKWLPTAGFDQANILVGKVIGGAHNVRPLTTNSAPDVSNFDYPSQDSNGNAGANPAGYSRARENLRIGANWDSGTFGQTPYLLWDDPDGACPNGVCNVSVGVGAFGANYPHPYGVSSNARPRTAK